MGSEMCIRDRGRNTFIDRAEMPDNATKVRVCGGVLAPVMEHEPCAQTDQPKADRVLPAQLFAQIKP